MPKTIHGEPVDEEKWEKAKQVAEEQGHGGEYDYIMGIYKRMAGIEKSRELDRGLESGYTDNRKKKLVLRKHREVRCPECGILLMKASDRLVKSLSGRDIEIKCKRCKTLVSM